MYTNNINSAIFDVRKTSNIANVGIYVKQTIGRLKVLHIVKNELPISLVPLADDR